MLRLAIGLVLTLVLVAGCGGPTGTALALPDGAQARAWGSGPYGLVLVPDAGHDAASWNDVAKQLAQDGMTVVAVDSADADVVVAALHFLLDERGLERAALLGAGTGADTALAVVGGEPGLVDQLIVLSANGDVSQLGELPKLFIASSGEAAAADATRMANDSAGAWNELYLAEGNASGQAILEGDGREGTLAAIMRRLDERR